MDPKLNRKKYHKLLVIVCIVFVVLIDVLFIVIPDKEKSETENRMLALWPRTSLTTIFNGSFEKNMEKYIADQFPGRTLWVRLESTADRMLGRTESHGIFLGKSGYLLQNFKAPKPEAFAERMDSVKAFGQRYKDVKQYALIAPSTLTVYDNKLPFCAPAGDENGFMDECFSQFEACGVAPIDVRSYMKSARKEKQLYYRTDHHWTTHGAYEAYKVMGDQLGLSGVNQIYKPMLISNQFSGTLTASSGYKMTETDEVYIYEPEGGSNVSVLYTAEGFKSSSMYDTKQLEDRDKYEVFFGGNHAQVEITTGKKNGKVLLVLKDSYANCFVPFLITDYEKIIMVDPRYYTDDLDMLMKVKEVNEVLYLYNAAGFAMDQNLKNTIDPKW